MTGHIKYILLVLIILVFSGFAQDSTGQVKLSNRVLLTIEQPEDDISANRRAALATEAIEDVMADPQAKLDLIEIDTSDNSYHIKYKGLQILHVLPQDTIGTGKTLDKLANDWYWEIRRAIASERESSFSFLNIGKFVLVALFPFLVILVYVAISKLFRQISKAVVKSEGVVFKKITLFKLGFIPTKLQVNITLKILIFFKWVTIALIYYAMVLLFLMLFPPTKIYTNIIIDASFRWLSKIGDVLVNIGKFIVAGFLLFILARILTYIVEFIYRHYKNSPSSTRIPDGALLPIKKLTKILISVLFIVALVAVIPGHGEYVALGILLIFTVFISIALLPFLTSAFSSLILHLIKHLKAGDVIRIDDAIGRIIKIGVIFTTIELEDNSQMSFMNYSLIKKSFIQIPQKTDTDQIESESQTDNGEESNSDEVQ